MAEPGFQNQEIYMLHYYKKSCRQIIIDWTTTIFGRIRLGQALEEITRHTNLAGFKWPNDLLISGAKVAEFC